MENWNAIRSWSKQAKCHWILPHDLPWRANESCWVFVSAEYIQHNPLVGDGKHAFNCYFTEMTYQYPNKEIEFVRAVAEGDLVALHTHQTWPDKEEYVTMDFLRFDENGKIEEHWVSIQKNLMKPKTIISCIKIIPKVSRCTVYMLSQKTKTKTQDVGKKPWLQQIHSLGNPTQANLVYYYWGSVFTNLKMIPLFSKTLIPIQSSIRCSLKTLMSASTNIAWQNNSTGICQK